MTESIRIWQERVHRQAVEKGWHSERPACEAKGVRNERHEVLCAPKGVDVDAVARMIALIHSEASEALEALREGRVDMYFVKDSRGNDKPEGVEAELADVIIRCLDTAGALGLDMESAIRRKHEYNVTRSHRHGGKAI